MAKKEISLEDFLTSTEAAAELGITPQRVMVLIREGRLNAARFGKSWAIRRADLDAVRDRPHGKHLTDWRDKKKQAKPDSGKSAENSKSTKPDARKKRS
jgi:excisionase family DNA binding protein